ncbi:hypothetical protein DPM19_29810 [Actinomadura craniellae]|uniref:DUF1579 domain-containing protein n=1 Tax=Actinomadura craniellae TaxID=2231787 RepID=A0A365GZY3_9ACTN|nr:hypothetical protein [Actinomadura craniellae]RAY11503.1 hypothetical protein DPM19_29810 [Actinomadura craniellae]
MRNTELEKLAGLVGEWTTTLSDAWFLEPAGTERSGTATIEWLGESLLVVRTVLHDGAARSETGLVIGRSDPNDAYAVLYQDDRGVCRQFAMTFGGGRWTMTRADPDFHQRFVADVEENRILGRWEASDDEGATWRKDFDLTFERA